MDVKPETILELKHRVEALEFAVDTILKKMLTQDTFIV